MSARSYLVTGGAGFIGAALVGRLVESGQRVRVLDDESRGASRSLARWADRLELVRGDVRDPAVVDAACQGMTTVFHLAAVNGTRNFYHSPERVLDVGLRGALNVVASCVSQQIDELFVASSSEVYHATDRRADETVSPSVPDPLNPRFSYGGSKIATELLALNYGRRHLKRVVVFRPHNVYGPAMGWEHVLPQFVLRMSDLPAGGTEASAFRILGTGGETRSFVYIDDAIDALLLLIEKAEHLGIYHIGTSEEVTMAELARVVADHLGRRVRVVPGSAAHGSTTRRCPDIRKIEALGYRPKIPLARGLPLLARWYQEHAHEAPPWARELPES